VLLVYANKTNLLGENFNITKKNREALLNANQKAGPQQTFTTRQKAGANM
jgi:hypothetical protein